MAAIPPPQGMSETDYDTIEAAVAETVRGRWFLAEFARRNRLAETTQLLEAMARLESVVLSGQTALPSADPSVRLLIQRIKEIAGQLSGVATDMRAAGIDARHVDAVDSQARAVSGLMRSAAPSPPMVPGAQRGPARARAFPLPASTPPTVEPSPARAQEPSPAAAGPTPSEPVEPHVSQPRAAALSRFDGMTFAEKLALFT